MTHNCWHNCELTEALQCLAPAYGDGAHRKVGERMKQDMEARERRVFIVKGDELLGIEGGRNGIGSAMFYPRDARVVTESQVAALPDLLAALEGLVELIGDGDDWGLQPDNKQWTAARAALAKARK